MTQLVGVFRIGADAELRSTSAGEVLRVALASNYGKRDAEGKRPTQWVDAALWGARAQKLVEHMKKGQSVYAVINDPHIETYKRNDGTEASKLVGQIEQIEFVGGKPQGGQSEYRTAARPQHRPAPPPQTERSSVAEMADDIPF